MTHAVVASLSCHSHSFHSAVMKLVGNKCYCFSSYTRLETVYILVTTRGQNCLPFLGILILRQLLLVIWYNQSDINCILPKVPLS